jgi:uncharacterized membrane protein YcaP (DUF421 family)
MDIVLRAGFAFCFLILLTRVVGRKELSSLEPIDIILLVVMGDLIQQGVTQSDYSVTGLVLAIGTFGFLQATTSWAAFRFRPVRKVLDGEPIVVMQDGKILEQNLRRERITLEDLAEEMRGQQIADFGDVKWAVLESNGKISFIPKKRG